MNLKPLDVAGLEVVTAVPDLRRDLHVFVDYARGRRVKRAHRDNLLSKTDAKRLAKLLSDPDAEREVDEQGFSHWLSFVDDLALRLGFVHYDTEGKYAGYSSHEPSFPENYVEYRAKPYEQFLAAKAVKQEATLRDVLTSQGQGSDSEFYRMGVLGRLEGFNQWGSATGVMPTLDFPAARRFLLGLLADCPGGQWLSTASLVDHLKQHHRYFLIPAKPQFKHQHDAGHGRYGNFHEGKDAWENKNTVGEGDPDAFERVEGRYVERFLEGAPLVLRYVDVAYGRKPAKALYPSQGLLKAFRVSERLRRALEGTVAEPRVTVTPSFDVHVTAETYPAGVLARIRPFCETVSEGTSFVLKLTKAKVAAAHAATPDLDPAGMLRKLCGGELPANVVHELAAWSEHGEKFTLFVNCAVLETAEDEPAADPFTVECVAAGIRVVRSPAKLFTALERRERMPVRVRHEDGAFTPLPPGTATRFPQAAPGREKPKEPKPSVTLTRQTRVLLTCPERQVLDKLHGLLLEGQCPVEVDEATLTLSYPRHYEPAVANAIRQLKNAYQIKMEDIAF